MSLRSVTNSISSIAGIAESTATKLGALTNNGGDNSAIRERYLNGFIGNTPQFVPQVFPRIFDEPTYLTFRIEFDFSDDLIQNNASTSADAKNYITGVDAFNYMPEPLLSLNPHGKSYSTYKYLLSALGEERRAAYIKQFVNSLKDIQNNYPFYFTTIEGLDTLTQINTERGIRLLDGENNKLTIKCLEGLDQKITQLMQLYRKAAWDDVYQRWILPDMMRFFTMKIYVSEMKLFHTMSKSSNKRKGAFVVDFSSSDVSKYARSRDQLSVGGSLLGGLNNFLNSAAAISANMLGDGSTITKFLEGANSVTETVDTVLRSIRGDMFLCDNAINDIMPTMCFECHMCEFDISSTLSHISNLSSSKNGVAAAEPSISIKVGRLVEKMIFPLQNGLLSSKDGYIIGKDLFNSVYINDDYLRKEATHRKEDLLKNDDRVPSYDINRAFSNKMYRINQIYGGSSSNNTGSSRPDNSIKESYNPFSPDKSAAAVSLFTGLAGVFFTDLKSTAIDGEVAQKTRENIESPINVSNYEDIREENRRKIVGSTAIDTRTLGATLSEATNGDTTLNSTIEDKNKNTLSEATDSDTNLTSTIEDTSSFSTATQSTNKIQQIIVENGADAVLSAATALKKTIDYFIDNEEIKSMATSPEQRERVANSLMMSTIEKISLSTATDPNSKALKDLATVMIEDVEMSMATSKSSTDKISRGALIQDPGKSAATAADRKFNTGTDAFSYLNN